MMSVSAFFFDISKTKQKTKNRTLLNIKEMSGVRPSRDPGGLVGG